MFISQRGSIWRKWDFHIHTPETKKNDQYMLPEGDVWKEFCKKIEESDVASFCITDYFSADGYFNFIGQFKARYPESKKSFFPNIELCTSDVVNVAGEEVNLHIIFNPEFPEMDKKIREFLQYLQTHKTDGSGRHIKASELSKTSDYEEATTSRDFIEDALKDVFGDKIDFTEIFLIFTSVNNDGLRTATEEVKGKMRGKKRKAIITDELDKFSHGFFGNSHNTDYFLNKKRLEVDKTTNQKPVVTGCDAHSFSELDNCLGKMIFKEGKILKESTWVKADLTFEGLRQIIFEPESRVFIGKEPEIEVYVRANPRRYLESVHIDQIESYDGRCGTWFKDEKIPLNKELVAIIGNKGSGKSALTDIIGLVGNSHNQKYIHANGKSEELFSFLNKDKFRKGNCANNFFGKLNWYAGDPDKCILDSETDTSILEEVEYLPQKYLEKICSNIEDDEFREKLNKVIFEYVKEKNRYGKDSLESLVSYLADQTEEDIQIAKEDLRSENKLVVEIEQKLSLDHKKDINVKIRLKKEEVKAHEKNKPTVVPKPPADVETSTQSAVEISGIETGLSDLSKKIEDSRKEQTTISAHIEELKKLRQEVGRQKDVLKTIETKYKSTLDVAGIKFNDIISFSYSYEQLDQVIKQKSDRLEEIEIVLRSESDIKQLELDPDVKEKLLKQSYLYKHTQLKTHKKEIVEKLDKPNRDYQAYLKNQEQWNLRKKALEGNEESPEQDTLNWLEQEKKKISDDYHNELLLARDRRSAKSKTIFKKKKSLVLFYESVKQSIDEEIKKYDEDLGDYDISIEASLRFNSSFYDCFFQYVSQSVKGSFYGSEEGKTILNNIVDSVEDWENEEEVFSVLQKIQDYIDFDKREGLSPAEAGTRDIFNQLKKGKEPIEFYDFLYGFEYLETKYDLEVDEKDLSELSPGERGGVLLIFYLMLDRRNIPLVIDQPEDNLDNKSVYEILVTFLKKAKKRRQIIIATHNPNLAVVADAEQIIHVSIDKKNNNDFNFYPGSIENSKINKEVVNILEGTRPAFDNRRLKYRK